MLEGKAAGGHEASVFTPIIGLLIVAMLFTRFYRENRYQVPAPALGPQTSATM